MKNSFVSISHSGNNVLGAINPADLARISRKNILPPWLSYLKPAAVIVTQQQLLSRPGEEIKVCWRAYFIYVRDVKTIFKEILCVFSLRRAPLHPIPYSVHSCLYDHMQTYYVHLMLYSEEWCIKYRIMPKYNFIFVTSQCNISQKKQIMDGQIIQRDYLWTKYA